MDLSHVRLRALRGTPLQDPKVRGVVVAAAGAIAERTGIAIAEIRADDEGVTVAIAADKLAALGFLAELRRSTNAWYAGKHPGESLWGEAPPPGDDVHADQ